MQKRVLCAAIASAMVLPSSAGAVKYKLSGQVSRAVAYYDDGQQSDVRHVDNQASGTRFRLRGRRATAPRTPTTFARPTSGSRAAGAS